MTRANTEQLKHTPWFAKAGAACSIVPISRFVGPNIFALKGGGYGCLFSLTGIDEEGLTDLELDSRMRSIEGALRGLPEGSCLYQYTRVMSGFDLPRQKQVCEPSHRGIRERPPRLPGEDRGASAASTCTGASRWSRRRSKAFERKPQENAARHIADAGRPGEDRDHS